MLPDSSSDRGSSSTSKRPISHVARVKMEHLEVKQEPGTWDGEVSNEYRIHKNLRLTPFNFMVMLLYVIFCLDVEFFVVLIVLV